MYNGYNTSICAFVALIVISSFALNTVAISYSVPVTGTVCKATFDSIATGGVTGSIYYVPTAAGGATRTLLVDLDFKTYYEEQELKSFLTGEPDVAPLCFTETKDFAVNEFPGFALHTHTKWLTDGDSAKDGECGGAFTGLHTDTTFACGPASENAAVCASEFLAEVNAAYNCSPTTFGESLYKTVNGTQVSVCQTGDLNRKFGTESATTIPLFALSEELSHVGMYDDPLGIAPADFASIDDQGLSVVVHCVSGRRLACAKITCSDVEEGTVIEMGSD